VVKGLQGKNRVTVTIDCTYCGKL